MSFVWFRKYHKPFLWFAVIFTVVVFATFSSVSDLKTVISGHPADAVVGEFKVAGSGEVRQVTNEEFQRLRTELNRFTYANGGADIGDDDVWAHIMTLADARAAGLNVAPGELAKSFPPGMTKEDYRRYWNEVLQFPSARDFEEFMRGLLLAQRYRSLAADAARVVDADEVYLRWRADNELFDIEAVVIPDLAVEAVPDPSSDVLQAWWDGMPESQRNARFYEPQKQDIVYAWLPLDVGTDVIPDEKLAGLPEPDPQAVAGRFEQLRATRWPEAEAMDDAAKAALVRELKIVELMQQAQQAFEASADKTAASFTEAMTAAGLRVVNPEGELGPDGIKSLEGIGDDTLHLWLGQRKAGETHFGYPYGGQNHVAVVYMESVTPSRPHTLEEARDAAVTAWKELQRDKPARDFRELVSSTTRALPDVAELLKPVLEAAQVRADEAVAAAADLDDAGREALRKEIMDEAEANDVLPRLAEHEHRVWKDLPIPEGSRRVELKGVSRAYARKPDDAAEPSDSIERFLKTNGAIFRLGVNGISQPLRHAPSGQSAVVAVTGRSFPDKAAMFADAASMEVARNQLAAQRQNEARMSFTPDRLKLEHELKVHLDVN